MSRPRFVLPITVLAVVAAAGAAVGCKGCRHGDEAASPDAGASADAAQVTAPYLPSRTAADDSPAPESQVEGILMQLRPELRSCYRSAALDNPKLEGKIVFKVTIAVDGRVKEILLDGAPDVDPRLVDCMRRVVARAKFAPPPGGRSASVMVPLEFKPPPLRDAGTP